MTASILWKMPERDPLANLPAELVLRILEFLPISSISRLSRACRGWQHFINQIDPDHAAIYKSSPDSAVKRRVYRENDRCFTNYLYGKTWPDLSRVMISFEDSLRQALPNFKQSTMTFDRPVWSFRCDFRNRWIITIGAESYMTVRDMDTGATLFEFPENSHAWSLRYHDGYLLIPALHGHHGQYQIEIWRASIEQRGHFAKQDAIFPPVQFKELYLSGDDMYILGTMGKTFVYDIKAPLAPPRDYSSSVSTTVYIDSNDDVVVHNVGWREYCFYSKRDGTLLGKLPPLNITRNVAHIVMDHCSEDSSAASETDPNWSKVPFERMRLTPGPLPATGRGSYNLAFKQDKWQGCMLDGKALIATSLGGRLMVCSDWAQAIQSPKQAHAVTTIIEYVLKDRLLRQDVSVKDRRVIFEASNRTYLMQLPRNDAFVHPESNPPIFAFRNSASPMLHRPLTHFELHSDCLLTTYQDEKDGETTEAIRILTFAPERC